MAAVSTACLHHKLIILFDCELFSAFYTKPPKRSHAHICSKNICFLSNHFCKENNDGRKDEKCDIFTPAAK